MKKEEEEEKISSSRMYSHWESGFNKENKHCKAYIYSMKCYFCLLVDQKHNQTHSMAVWHWCARKWIDQDDAEK